MTDIKAKPNKKSESQLCDANELSLPKNAVSWNCTKSDWNQVQRQGICKLQCGELFMPENSECPKLSLLSLILVPNPGL